MKCPRCGKHRLRIREETGAKYCKGCGWEKKVVIEEPKKPEVPAFIEPLPPPKDVVVMTEWMRHIQDEVARSVGIPKELMELREPEPKKSLLGRLWGRFRGRS